MPLEWQKLIDCPVYVPNCDCPEPAEAPVYVGEFAQTPCGGSSSSSSPSSPSSLESSSQEASSSEQPVESSDSEQPCAGGWCQYMTTGDPPGSGQNLYFYPLSQQTPCTFGGGGECACGAPNGNASDYPEYTSVFATCYPPYDILSVGTPP